MRRSVFITGTDTGVGKTYVTALILAELRRQGVKAAAFKPIACGRGGRHDAEIYRKLMSDEQPVEVINPVYLKHPLAPSVAAKLEHERIDLKIIFASYRLLAKQYDVVLVEGAGGLLVPIKRNYFVADLARELKLPVLIVARLGLGTINHTLLTVRQTKNVAGIVLNDTTGKRGFVERTNIVEIPKLTGVPLLGVVSRGAKDAKGICRKLSLL